MALVILTGDSRAVGTGDPPADTNNINDVAALFAEVLALLANTAESDPNAALIVLQAIQSAGGFGPVPLANSAAPASPVSGVTLYSAGNVPLALLPAGPPMPLVTYGGIFGTGTDGSMALNGTNVIPGMSLAGSTYTMSRDIQAAGITISGGVTLKPSNFRIFCQGTLSNAGTITAAGAAGSGVNGGASGGSGSLEGGRAGGGGGTGVNGAGNPGSNTQFGVAGGAGGAGTSGTAGAGGTIIQSATVAQNNLLQTPYALLIGQAAFAAAPQVMGFGAGGGGGGSDSSSNVGGGGGAGGGIAAIFAWSVINTGTISAAGGNAAAAAAGNAGGGGGGSGGLIAAYTLSPWTAGTTTVAAGALGAGHGSGQPGTAGGAGLVLNIVVQ